MAISCSVILCNLNIYVLWVMNHSNIFVSINFYSYANCGKCMNELYIQFYRRGWEWNFVLGKRRDPSSQDVKKSWLTERPHIRRITFVLPPAETGTWLPAANQNIILPISTTTSMEDHRQNVWKLKKKMPIATKAWIGNLSANMGIRKSLWIMWYFAA